MRSHYSTSDYRKWLAGWGLSASSHCFCNGLLAVILQLRIPKPEQGTLGFVQSFGISVAQRSAGLMSLTDALLWQNDSCYYYQEYFLLSTYFLHEDRGFLLYSKYEKTLLLI